MFGCAPRGFSVVVIGQKVVHIEQVLKMQPVGCKVRGHNFERVESIRRHINQMASVKELDPQGPTRQEWVSASDEHYKMLLVELASMGEDGWLTLTISRLADYAHPMTRKYAASQPWVEHYVGIKQAERDDKHFNVSLGSDGKSGPWAPHILADAAWISLFGATEASRAIATQRLDEQRKFYTARKMRKALKARMGVLASKRKGQS